MDLMRIDGVNFEQGKMMLFWRNGCVCIYFSTKEAFIVIYFGLKIES